MNWIKIYHFKRGDTISVNITNMSCAEVTKILYELNEDFTIQKENETSIFVINENEIEFIEVRCVDEPKIEIIQ